MSYILWVEIFIEISVQVTVVKDKQMVSVEHAKGEDMEKTLSHTIAPRN